MAERFTIEEVYIKKALALFGREDEDFLKKIENCIRWVSSQVMCILRLNPDNKSSENGMVDVIDYIWDEELRKNKKFLYLLNQFIINKTSWFRYNVNDKTNWTNDGNLNNKIPKNPEELVLMLNRYLNVIQEYAIKIEEDNETLEWMNELISSKTIITAKKIVKEAKEELKNDLIVIDRSIDLINNLLNIVESKKEIFSKNQELLNNIYNKNWEIISKIEVDKISLIISNFKEIIDCLEEKIKEIEERKMIEEIQENSAKLGIEEDSLEEKYVLELLELFDGSEKNLVTSTLQHLYTWIDWIATEQNYSSNKKIEILNTPLEEIEAFNPKFLNNNKRAIEKLKIILRLYINRILETLEQDKYSLVLAIPKKYKKQILIQLNKIVEIYIENNKKEKSEENMSFIKWICELFIKELDYVLPNLLRSIEQKEDIARFKVDYIIPILDKLWIPRNLYNEFMIIVDIYNIEKKWNLIELAWKDFLIRKKLSIALLNLEDALKKCNLKDSISLEKHIIFIQNNMPERIVIDITVEKEEARIENTTKKWATPWDTISKIHQLSLRWKTSETQPKDRILEMARLKIKEQKKLVKSNIWILNKQTYLSLPQKNMLDTISYFMNSYWKIPEVIKNELKTYIESYYIFYKSCMLRDQMTINRIFSENRNFRQE